MKRINRDIARLLDANLNRAIEGIRVMEETARMILDDIDLTSSLKHCRHTLVQIMKSSDRLERDLILFRGSDHDVLREGETVSERTRTDISAIVRANAGRSQEAVRSLEEYVKLVQPELSVRLKEVRFRLYDMEKSLLLLIEKAGCLAEDRLRLFAVIEYEAGETVTVRLF